MKDAFWLIPGELAGRPGPDLVPWDLAAMRSAGIAAVLSVNDGLLCHPEDFEKQGISYRCVPLAANAPPQPWDDELCLRARARSQREACVIRRTPASTDDRPLSQA